VIISDVSSDDDDTSCEEKFDKRRNYNFTIYDPERKLTNQMHRKIFQKRKQIQSNYRQKHDYMKPKKHSVKSSRDSSKKNNLQLRRIISNHSVKYSLEFQKNNSQSHRITSVKEANCGQTLHSKTQEQRLSVKNNGQPLNSKTREQTLSVKNKVLTEGITPIDTPQRANQGRILSTKDGGFLPEMAYVKKLEIENKRRDREYLRAILEADVSSTDLNSLCTHKENDAEAHLLLNMNESHTENNKQIESVDILTALTSNEEPLLPFLPVGEKSSSEMSSIASPPAADLTSSLSFSQIRKTSTPYSQVTGINCSISPIKYAGRQSRTSSVSVHQSETQGNGSDSIPSPAVQNIHSDKYRITLREKKKNKKNSTEMGYVRLYVFI
jgi:hypothetical protein